MAREKQYLDELKMEVKGSQYSSPSDNSKQNTDEDMMETREETETVPEVEQIANDTANMSKILMSRKKKGLYEAMKVTSNASLSYS